MTDVEAGLFARICAEVGPGAIDALSPHLASDELTTGRARAADIVRRFGVRAVGRLGRLIGSPIWTTRRNAADLLGDLAVPEGVPLLQPLLRGGDARVTRAAVRALSAIADPAAARAIHTVLRAATGEQRRAVVDALVAQRDARVVPVLVRILQESDAARRRPSHRDRHTRGAGASRRRSGGARRDDGDAPKDAAGAQAAAGRQDPGPRGAARHSDGRCRPGAGRRRGERRSDAPETRPGQNIDDAGSEGARLRRPRATAGRRDSRRHAVRAGSSPPAARHRGAGGPLCDRRPTRRSSRHRFHRRRDRGQRRTAAAERGGARRPGPRHAGAGDRENRHPAGSDGGGAADVRLRAGRPPGERAARPPGCSRRVWDASPSDG